MDTKKLSEVMRKSLEGIRYREAELDVRKVHEDEEDNRRSFSVSSTEPDLRFIYSEKDGFVIANEVLSHSKKAVDLSRFLNGANILLDHNPTDVVGVIEDAKTVRAKRLEVDMRFSKNPRGQETKIDVDDSIRQNVSIGYTVQEYELREDLDFGNGFPTYEATHWQPAEASFVGVPADATVGPGRSVQEIIRRDLGLAQMDDEKYMELFEAATELLSKDKVIPEKEIVIKQEDIVTEAANPAELNQQENKEMSDKKTEVQEPDVQITAEHDSVSVEFLATIEKHEVTADQVRGWKERGLDENQMNREILNLMTEKRERLDVSDIQLTEKETKVYNLGRGLKSVITGESCFEQDVSDEIGKRRGDVTRGLFMPTSVRSLNANLGSTTGDGAEIVFEIPGDFIDLLRAKTVLGAAGATFLSGLTRKMAFPRQTSSPAATWVAEDPGSDVSQATMSLDQVQIEPRTLTVSSPYTRQLAILGDWDISALIVDDYARGFAVSLETVALEGGDTNEPTGVVSASGVTDETAASVGSGSFPDGEMFANMEKALAEGNADLGNPMFVTTPGVRALARVSAISGSGGIPVPIWGMDNTILGYPALVSNLVPNINFRDGGNDANTAIFADWSRLMVADWGAIEFIVDELTGARQALVNITALGYFDVALRTPASFVMRNDIRDAG